MSKHFIALVFAIAFTIGSSEFVVAQDDDTAPHDLSRSQLYEIFVEKTGLEDPQIRAAGRFFKFPYDADDDWIYGIDISHHKGAISWPKMKGQKVAFVYSKATEGVTFVDRRFKANVIGARKIGFPTGVYHFLSSGTPASTQAAHFLKHYKEVRSSKDLPPVLDLEWDYSRKTGKDRWKNLTRNQIVNKAKVWLDAVEAELGVKPIIYTNKFWWESLLGAEGNRLKSYKIWMSRYGKWKQPNPPMMSGFQWDIWQFTEEGSVPGVKGDVDVNKLSKSFGVLDVPETISCKIPNEPKAQAALSDGELQAVFDALRVQFGPLDKEQVEFLNLFVNTSPPNALRKIISGTVETPITSDELKEAFDSARRILTGGSLNKQQTDMLDVLLSSASAETLRTCLFR